MTPTHTPWMARTIQFALALLERFRYLKFGIVGASGTVLNLAVLYVAQEYLFVSIAARQERLYVSLATAIFVATINNFTWNRLWTWADRMLVPKGAAPGGAQGRNGLIFAQFLRYTLASWLGIALNYGLTLWAAQHMHYLLGNLLSIVAASVVNFLANDRWTFRKTTPP
jgi:putative flippase GtrA